MVLARKAGTPGKLQSSEWLDIARKLQKGMCCLYTSLATNLTSLNFAATPLMICLSFYPERGPRGPHHIRM